MSIKLTNFAYSTLASGISAVDTMLSVAIGHGARFPALGAGEYFYATLESGAGVREIVKVTARAVDSFTIVRAQDNTVAQSWLAGDSVALRLNVATFEDKFDTRIARTSATGSAVMPSGTTAQRDGSPAAGYVRYNTTLSRAEHYTTAWLQFVDMTNVTGSLRLPVGTTAQRDGSPAQGYLRANSDLTRVEWYNGTGWAEIGGGQGATGGGTDAVFSQTDDIVSTSWEIGQNALVSGVTVTIASPAVFSLTGHGFVAGSHIRFTTTGALPTGLSTTADYYVIATGLTADAFQVSTTAGGSAVNTSGSQSGTHSVAKIKNAVSGGPVTVLSGATVTVPTGAAWTVV